VILDPVYLKQTDIECLGAGALCGVASTSGEVAGVRFVLKTGCAKVTGCRSAIAATKNFRPSAEDCSCGRAVVPGYGDAEISRGS